MKTFFSLILILLLFSCQKNVVQENNDSHIKYFGFTLIDVFWDDPLDAEIKTNYLDEVASFSNIADILVVNPSDNIISRLDYMNQNSVKAIIHLNDIFFEKVDNNAPSGSNYNLKSDYKTRWDTFIAASKLQENKSKIQALYLGEEPTWNGISFEELKAASDYIKTTLPEIPILLIEASVILNKLKVPNTIDWVGFDHYFIKDPKNNTQFLSELSILKSKLANNSQKLVLVMDSHFIKEIHQDINTIAINEMKDIATSYYELSKTEPKVIAILGYTWPGGFDTPTALGARQLPQSVKDEYIRIGKEITGK